MHRLIGLVIMFAGLTVLFVMYQNRVELLGLDKIPRILNVPERTVQIPGIHPTTVGTPTATTGSGGKPATTIVSAPKPTPAPKPISYAKKVRIGNVSQGTYPRPHSEVTLYSAADIFIDITGWKIRSKTDTLVIPKALQYYTPLYEAGSETDIVLRPNDRVIMYSSASPVGTNFRLNKCIGYVALANNFSPSLPVTCPAIDYTSLRYLSGECQNYIRSLNSCRVPPPTPPIEYNPSCNAFLQTLNYQSCFNGHKSDSDFLSNEVRVWLGDSFGNTRVIFDRYHDIVQLVAPSGEVVDEYNY
ncbi:MAG: hypothetical protein Q7R85_02495 [bacterium]|nr:hypothetical protein [bacterium]